MARKESMDMYAKRRMGEKTAQAEAKEAGMYGGTSKPKSKDSPASKDGGPNGWKKGAGKTPKGC